MAGCQMSVIDIKSPRCCVHLIGIDHGELRHHSLVLVPHQVAVIHVRRQRVLVRTDLIASRTVSPAASNTVSFQPSPGSALAAPSGTIWNATPWMWQLCVVNRPQLRGLGSDHSVDPGQVHLLTVDLPTVELKRAASHHMIRCHCGTGLQPFRNPTARSQRGLARSCNRSR